MKNQTGLGKGLSALIPQNTSVAQAPINNDDGKTTGVIALVEITKVKANPFQPRIVFNPEALADLVQSIVEHGVIQPITVRRSGNGYELISGERRIRASIEAGLDTIPAYIVDIGSDESMIELALIENVQRENLNDIEIAMGYQLLIHECNLNQDQVAQKVGKNRATISNFLRLLKLPNEVQQMLATRAISNGHARALLSLTSSQNQIEIAHKIVEEDLSVRDTEDLIKTMMGGLPSKKSKKKSTGASKSHPSKPLDTSLLAIEDQLREHFATQVSINVKAGENGSLEIAFYSFDDLQRLVDLIIDNKR